jgi:hypothetical protein
MPRSRCALSRTISWPTSSHTVILLLQHLCPLDVKASGWYGFNACFNACSKNCGTIGTDTKTRSVITPAAHIDLAAPALTQIKPCNRLCCTLTAMFTPGLLAPRPAAPWAPRPAVDLFSPMPPVVVQQVDRSSIPWLATGSLAPSTASFAATPMLLPPTMVPPTRPRLAPSLPLLPTAISLPPPSPRSGLATGSVAPLTAMFPPGRPLLDYLHQDLRHHGHQDSLCHSILTHASCVVVQKRKRQPPLSRLSLVP